MKTARHAKVRGTNGSALITVMLVIMVVLLVSGAIAGLSMQMPTQIRRQTDAIRAKTIAEAGINQTYSALAKDFSLRNDSEAFPASVFAGGDYDVTVTPVGNRMARLYSQGRYGRSTVRVGMDVRNVGAMGEYGDGGASPWGYAIFANGDLRLNGTPPAVRGALHTNQEFRLNGVPDNVEGIVTARSFFWTGGELPPEQIGVFREIPFPRLTDEYFVQLLETAQANGAVRNGGTYRQTELDALPGGVAWFNGNVTLHGSFTYNGIMVVTGNIIFRGSGTRTLHGLMFTPGHITANGETTMYLTGSMMAGGNIEYNGASSLFTYDAVGPIGDDDGQAGADRIVVTAWWEE